MCGRDRRDDDCEPDAGGGVDRWVAVFADVVSVGVWVAVSAGVWGVGWGGAGDGGGVVGGVSA